MKPWHLTGKRQLSVWDRLRLLFGVPLYIRFVSPDGECHASCEIETFIRSDWPPEPITRKSA